MKFNFKYLLFFAFFLLVYQNVSANRIQSGFQALLIKDYFKSQKKFKKALKYNPSISAYGLSIIYSRDDNPFFNIDSAYRYILISDSSWLGSKETKKVKWSKYGWSKNAIDSLKILISTQFYFLVEKEDDLISYNTFIKNHPWALEIKKAVDNRDSLECFNSLEINTLNSLSYFLDLYPNSKYRKVVENKFYNLQYNKHTKSDSLESYLSFISLYPENPRAIDAEKRIFELVTKSNKVESYEDFLTNYSDKNNFNKIGWNQFYEVYLFNYSKQRKIEFLNKFPNAKNIDFVRQDILLTDSIFLPYFKDQKYGFLNQIGNTIIPPIYDNVGEFHEGLAVVEKNELQGVLNKHGDIQIPFIYHSISDFNYGRALVELDGKFGLIDRNNKLILNFIYEDIGDISDGLIYVKKNEKYGYFDLNGNLVIDYLFDEAFDFKNGLAIIELDKRSGIINKSGRFLIQPTYDNIRLINDSLFVFSQDGNKGILNSQGNILTDSFYENIGSFSDGLAIVTKSDSLFYININGDIIIDNSFRTYPNYLSKGEFNNGKAIVFKEGKYGIIDLNGDIVIDFLYDNLGYSANMVSFYSKNKWGLLDTSNKTLSSLEYQYIDLFENGFAVASIEDSIGMLNDKGEKAIPFSYKKINWLSGDYFKVFDGDKYALFNGGEKLTEFEFNDIELFNDHFLSLLGDNGLNYFVVSSGKFIKIK